MKNNKGIYKMKKHLIYGAIIASLTSNASAITLKAEVSPGYDSNPYKLSDSLDNGEAWFVDTNVFIKQKLAGLTLSGSLKNRAHEGSFNNADVFTGRLKALYKKTYAISDKKVVSRLGIQTGFKDKTYVSRSTGDTGTFSGQKIEDRYDYDYWRLLGSSSIQLSDQVRTALALTYNNKSYDDQNITGISTLDYEQANLVNTWTFKHNSDGRFKLDLGIGERDYDNRRQKSKAGALVAGSDLKYFYHNVELSHRYKITQDLRTNVGIEYEERTDNGSGYYDTDKIKYSADVFYTVDKGFKLYAKSSYEDYEYDSLTTTDENDEDLPGKQGYTVKLGVEKDLSELTDMPVLGFAGIRFDNFDSNDPVYEYDRYQAFMGIKVNFEK